MTVPPDAVPKLPRGVRLHEDKVRGRWVLLAPERTISLDPIGHAILAEVDGERSFRQIVTVLAERYAAPREQIATDASEYLTGLVDRCILDIAA